MVFTLTDSVSPAVLVNTLFSWIPGLTTQNIQVTGAPKCRGTFAGGSTVVTDAAAGFPDSGIVLGTGLIVDLIGQDGTQNYYDFGTPGDPDIYGGTEGTFDACTLELEFRCENNAPGAFSMEYTFSSDLYMERVNENLGYSDAFKVILNGDNLALTPDNEAVSIYTVNDQVNSEFFVFNNPRPGQAAFPDFEPDGFTKGLAATGQMRVGWNTLKIGIVDVNDPFLDSWLLMKTGTFSCPPPQETEAPTSSPSVTPSEVASVVPSVSPSAAPSEVPSVVSVSPSAAPSEVPSVVSVSPSAAPSEVTSGSPSIQPSAIPSVEEEVGCSKSSKSNKKSKKCGKESTMKVAKKIPKGRK